MLQASNRLYHRQIIYGWKVKGTLLAWQAVLVSRFIRDLTQKDGYPGVEKFVLHRCAPDVLIGSRMNRWLRTIITWLSGLFRPHPGRRGRSRLTQMYLDQANRSARPTERAEQQRQNGRFAQTRQRV